MLEQKVGRALSLYRGGMIYYGEEGLMQENRSLSSGSCRYCL